MDTNSIALEYSNKFNRIHKMYEEDDLQGVIDGAEELLDDSKLPKHLRMKTLILLACCTDDWDDAEELRNEAEDMYHIAHAHWPRDAEVNEVLREIRKCLDCLGKAQYEKMWGEEEEEEEEEEEVGGENEERQEEEAEEKEAADGSDEDDQKDE
ncbi:hypothetical protein BC567DRAFT_261519 [Phyllosticta citribraziliensis]